MASFRYGRSARLAGRRDFDAVFGRGRRLKGDNLILWHVAAGNPSAPARFGVSIGAKFGIAVRRNRAKRLVREAFRLNRESFRKGLSLVAYPRPGCRWKTMPDAAKDLLDLSRKAGLLAS